MTRAALGASFLLGVAACAAPAGPPSCGDDLHGVWVAPAGARWMLLDNRPHPATLEAYPLFPDAADVVAPPGVVVAPRVIDLRAGSGVGLAGDVLRRYTRGGDACEMRAPIHVTACTAAGLEVVLADPAAPVGFAPCARAPGAPSRREIWKRE